MRVWGQMTEFSTRARSSTKQPGPNTELMICAPGLIWQSSPIIDESEHDEHAGSPDLEIEEGVCYFNDEAFAIGEFVRSGSEVLQCAERGVWLRKGDKRPG